jgi:alpha-ketoglutarate-dependent taurine dioxygenase
LRCIITATATIWTSARAPWHPYAVSGSSFRIEEMPDDEAHALLDELKAHATQARYHYRLKYGVGDVVVWDNASLLHSATLIDPKDARTLWRITVKEERKP